MEIPLLNRRDALEAFFASPRRPELQLSKFTRNAATAERWLKDAGDGSTDGVVAKLLGDAYRPGERAMIKVKRMRTADCVVGGFRYLAERREVGSLLLGLYDEEGKLDHVGFTSTIDNEARPAEPLKPELVVEVRFDHVTGDRFRQWYQVVALAARQATSPMHVRADRLARNRQSGAWQTIRQNPAAGSNGTTRLFGEHVR